jgi:hypothetical protein
VAGRRRRRLLLLLLLQPLLPLQVALFLLQLQDTQQLAGTLVEGGQGVGGWGTAAAVVVVTSLALVTSPALASVPPAPTRPALRLAASSTEGHTSVSTHGVQGTCCT